MANRAVRSLLAGRSDIRTSVEWRLDLEKVAAIDWLVRGIVETPSREPAFISDLLGNDPVGNPDQGGNRKLTPSTSATPSPTIEMARYAPR
jgi:hypothetical protein